MKRKRQTAQSAEVVGLIPAAGLGKRIAPLPFSKELFPIFEDTQPRPAHPRAVCEFLLRNMRASGIYRAFVIVRKGKWDILSHLGPGDSLGMSISYLIMGRPYGVPYSLDQAYLHVRDKLVALGFPDILFTESEAYRNCLMRLSESEADVVLGLFPADQPTQVDMVEIDDGGLVRRIDIKPERTDLSYAWGIAVWKPDFTEFIHSYLELHEAEAKTKSELYVGDVVRKAIVAGMRVEAISVSDHPFLDIGSPEGLARAISFRTGNSSDA